MTLQLLSAHDAGEALAREAARLGLPAADPMRGGTEFDRLVESCISMTERAR